MRGMRIGPLQWAVGALCAVVGALMLIVPHQFEAPEYAALRPRLAWWGVAYLLSGTVLLTVAALTPKRAVVVASHLCAAGGVLILARGFALQGSWTQVSLFTVLGLGTAFGVLRPYSRERRLWSGRGDLFAIAMGLAATTNGFIVLVAPESFPVHIAEPLRPYLHWYGSIFLAGGLALIGSQIVPALPRPSVMAAHPLAGASFFVHVGATSFPNRNWNEVACYGGFGALLALLPWLAPLLGRFDPASLRARLTLALAIGAALPLIVTLSLVKDHDRRSMSTQVLTAKERMARDLAQDVADYINLHHSIVAVLAVQPDLASMLPSRHQALLQTFSAAYPEVALFHTHDAEGNPIARSDDLPLQSIIDLPDFREVRRTNGPSLEVRMGRVDRRPVFSFGAPIRDSNGQFAGMVGASLEPTHVAALLSRTAAAGGGGAYLVDASGQIIAHPDASFVPTFADLSAAPPVAELLGALRSSGSLGYSAAGEERLAGYAHVPGLGWGVVVERPAAAALVDVQAGSDFALTMLLTAIALGAIVGAVAASRLVAALEALAGAAGELATGNVAAPLPRSSISEVAHLSASFSGMREALASRTARLQLILDSVGDGIIGADLQGTATFVNPAAARMLGYRVHELIGQPLHELMHESEADGPPCLWQECRSLATLRDGAVRQLSDTLFWRKNGSSFAVEAVSAPILERGQIVGAVVAFQDITARREMERMKNHFVSIVSHELRTPLTSIRGSLGLLASEKLGPFPEQGRRMLEIAVSNTDRLVRLIDDILDIERMESSKVAMQKKACCVVDLMTQAAEGVQGMAEQALVNLSVTPPQGWVWADSDRIIQTLTNLLSNAVKFSAPGGTVLMAAERRGQQMVFQVQDKGRGIPADKLELIFERFKQVDASDSRERGGSGLGLTICRSIVQQHGGRIWVESTPGRGSTFFFSVPAIPEDSPATASPGSNGPMLLVYDENGVCGLVGSLSEQREPHSGRDHGMGRAEAAARRAHVQSPSPAAEPDVGGDSEW
jgi:PAS domain S-box-containing protein